MSFVCRNHPQQTASRGVLDEVDDRQTPDDLFEEVCALVDVKTFDTDPAATMESSRAPLWYDRTSNGLEQAWRGVVWLNPPYSDLENWTKKAVEELRAGHASRVVMLYPANRTEQAWWHRLIEPRIRCGRWSLFHLEGRRRFNRPGWTAPKKGDRPPFGLIVIDARGEDFERWGR